MPKVPLVPKRLAAPEEPTRRPFASSGRTPMRTRMTIGIALVAALAGATYAENLAAAYVAVAGAATVYLLHTIEFKLNKLLDHHGVSVPDFEIARD